MKTRIHFKEISPQLYDGLSRIQSFIKRSEVEPKLMELIKYRVSQINGCAFCLDMHHKEAIHLGEQELRLHTLLAWRECPYFSEKEKAALAYAEALTIASEQGMPDEIYDDVAKYFDKSQILVLTAVIMQINSWNRLNIAFRPTPGNYVIGQFEK